MAPMHMNSLAPISISATPMSLWKCGTIFSVMLLIAGDDCARYRKAPYPAETAVSTKHCEKAANAGQLWQVRNSPTMENRNRLTALGRHPAAAVVLSALFAIAAAFFLRGGIAAHQRLTAADDPVAVTDQALAATFDRDAAEREIRNALAAGDVDLAQSFVALAAERDVPIEPALGDKLKQTEAEQRTFANTAGRFV